ncbi:unnamed protein product [Symbiodinium sp. CCMP2592]|nr:unnamed protein product [Symbiodinium sp. CCMP2592]
MAEGPESECSMESGTASDAPPWTQSSEDMVSDVPLAQCARCVQLAWSTIVRVCGRSDLQESMLSRVIYTSSSCTGAYTGEMALAVIEKTINESGQLRLPVVFSPVRVHDRYSVIAAWETSKNCHQLITDHARWCEEVAGQLRAIDRSDFCAGQYCYQHGKVCSILGDPAKKPDYDISGLPCPDFSRAGQKRGREGQTSSVFACHAKLHVHLGTPMLVIENVQELDMQMIMLLYGRYYDIQQLWVSPSDQGHSAVARDRTYLILARRGLVEQVHDPRLVYQQVSDSIRARVSTRPRDYFVATRRQVLQEGQRAAMVRKTVFRKAQRLDYLLNERERSALRMVQHRYREVFRTKAALDPDLVVHLGDNPQNRLTWSAHSGRIPTLRKGSGKMYNPFLKRWMVPVEKLSALGFPVTKDTAIAMGVPMLPVADYLRAAAVAGNSFHFSSAAVVQLEPDADRVAPAHRILPRAGAPPPDESSSSDDDDQTMFPNVQPGRTRPENQLRNPPKAATKATTTKPALSRSQQGRRAVKATAYKSQSKLADFVVLVSDSHILDWMSEIDPTYLHKDTLKDQSRVRLFSCLAFNVGWLPEDPKPGNDFTSVVAAAKAQYSKRGSPATFTGWSIKEQHMFMRWQLDLFKNGWLRRADVGGFAWKLPEKGKHGKPAELPAEVVDFCRDPNSVSREGRLVGSHGSSSHNEDPYGGFKLEDRDGSFTLSHKPTNRAVQLPKLRRNEEEYEIYTHDGFVCLAGGSFEPSYCEDLIMEFDDDGQGEANRGRHRALVPHAEGPGELSRQRASNKPMQFKNLRASGHSPAL